MVGLQVFGKQKVTVFGTWTKLFVSDRFDLQTNFELQAYHSTNHLA